MLKKETNIKLAQTRQFIEIIAALEDAKQYGENRMIICQSGAGKTYSVDKFVKANPQHTYRVTVSSMHRKLQIMLDLLQALGINRTYSRIQNVRLHCMVEKVKEIAAEPGAQPVIIFDEAENLSVPALGFVKAIYDAVKDYCPIVLIGTPQLHKSLYKLQIKDVQGIPQFMRRFKAGTRQISEVSTNDKEQFVKPYTSDKGLVKLLVRLCDNYGEISDFLEPVLRLNKQKGEGVTEELFRKYHGITQQF